MTGFVKSNIFNCFLPGVCSLFGGDAVAGEAGIGEAGIHASLVTVSGTAVADGGVGDATDCAEDEGDEEKRSFGLGFVPLDLTIKDGRVVESVDSLKYGDLANREFSVAPLSLSGKG